MFSAIYGLSHGGLLQPIYTQTHMWLFALVFALTAMNVLTTAADFRRLSDAVVYAAIWRSCTALTFYMMIRGSWPMPQVMTISPRNSVLAVLAFYGGLGFAGLWLILPLSVYFSARTYQVSHNPVERSVAVTGIVQVRL